MFVPEKLSCNIQLLLVHPFIPQKKLVNTFAFLKIMSHLIVYSIYADELTLCGIFL